MNNLHKFIKSFNDSEVIYYDQRILDEKILRMSNDKSKIIVIADFDYTLTSLFHHKEGKKNHSSFSIIENSKYINDEFTEKNKILYEKYHHYENDHTLEFELKQYFMNCWWGENLDLCIEQDLKKFHFKEMFSESEGYFFFRNGINEFLKILEDHNIPLFIISAGVRDIIEVIFEELFPNFHSLKLKGLFHIMGNKFIYDENQNLVGYEKPVITTFSKNSSFKDLFSDIIPKDSKIILLGDHLNDSEIISLINYEEAFYFAFFNYNPEDESKKDLFSEYLKKYHVIIQNDGNLTFVNKILNDILAIN